MDELDAGRCIIIMGYTVAPETYTKKKTCCPVTSSTTTKGHDLKAAALIILGQMGSYSRIDPQDADTQQTSGGERKEFLGAERVRRGKRTPMIGRREPGTEQKYAGWERKKGGSGMGGRKGKFSADLGRHDPQAT